jgi:hypothetical protein
MVAGLARIDGAGRRYHLHRRRQDVIHHHGQALLGTDPLGAVLGAHREGELARSRVCRHRDGEAGGRHRLRVEVLARRKVVAHAAARIAGAHGTDVVFDAQPQGQGLPGADPGAWGRLQDADHRRIDVAHGEGQIGRRAGHAGGIHGLGRHRDRTAVRRRGRHGQHPLGGDIATRRDCDRGRPQAQTVAARGKHDPLDRDIVRGTRQDTHVGPLAHAQRAIGAAQGRDRGRYVVSDIDRPQVGGGRITGAVLRQRPDRDAGRRDEIGRQGQRKHLLGQAKRRLDGRRTAARHRRRALERDPGETDIVLALHPHRHLRTGQHHRTGRRAQHGQARRAGIPDAHRHARRVALQAGLVDGHELHAHLGTGWRPRRDVEPHGGVEVERTRGHGNGLADADGADAGEQQPVESGVVGGDDREVDARAGIHQGRTDRRQARAGLGVRGHGEGARGRLAAIAGTVDGHGGDPDLGRVQRDEGSELEGRRRVHEDWHIVHQELDSGGIGVRDRGLEAGLNAGTGARRIERADLGHGRPQGVQGREGHGQIAVGEGIAGDVPRPAQAVHVGCVERERLLRGQHGDGAAEQQVHATGHRIAVPAQGQLQRLGHGLVEGNPDHRRRPRSRCPPTGRATATRPGAGSRRRW